MMAPLEPFAEIDSVLRLVDREVWVVTAATDSRRGGLIATWISQVSLAAENPVMLIGLAPNHFTSELISAAGQFGLHLFTDEQASVALPFAIGSGRDRDKLAGVDYQGSEWGTPILGECAAWLDCRVFHSQGFGDRIFYWAEVVAGKRNSSGAILRESGLITQSSDAELASLRRNREEDITALEAERLKWRESLET